MRPVGPPKLGNRFVSSRACLRAELVRSLSDGFGSRPVGFFKQPPGGFQKMSRRMSNSSMVLRVAVDIGLTVQGFYGHESKNDQQFWGSMGMTEKVCVFYRGCEASASVAWPSQTK